MISAVLAATLLSSSFVALTACDNRPVLKVANWADYIDEAATAVSTKTIKHCMKILKNGIKKLRVRKSAWNTFVYRTMRLYTIKWKRATNLTLSARRNI